MNNKCFFISAIGDNETHVRKHSDRVIKTLIKPVMDSIGFQVIRADNISGSSEIVKDIYQHLNEDEIVIADITFNNPNVFFEIGYRFHNEKDHEKCKMPILIRYDGAEDEVPFDIKGYRYLNYELSADTINEERQLLLEYAGLNELPNNMRTLYDRNGNKVNVIILPNKDSR